MRIRPKISKTLSERCSRNLKSNLLSSSLSLKSKEIAWSAAYKRSARELRRDTMRLLKITNKSLEMSRLATKKIFRWCKRTLQKKRSRCRM